MAFYTSASLFSTDAILSIELDLSMGFNHRNKD